ncbi:MAG: hypothetical protein L0Y54_05010 [Sporichthyaceae bacterium]|nr:hypothetical protein [Sporichthyaceae bacterium]
MNRRWLGPATALLALAVLGSGGCGGDEPTSRGTSPPPVTPTPTPSTPGPTPTTPSPPAGCGTDLLGADRPSVQLQPPGATARTDVGTAGPFPCGSRVWVDGGGVGAVLFTDQGACNLVQNTGAKPATAVVRAPDGTMLRLDQGSATCTLGQPILVCAPGSITPTSPFTQVVTTCDPDPVFRVAVFAGTATVLTPAGEELGMGPGQQLECDPTQCSGTTTNSDAQFSAEDRQAFSGQLRELELTPNSLGTG